MNSVGHFLLSLDTELAWGHFDSFRPGLFSHDGSRERFMIDRILDILDEYGIIGTWSFVGHLMLERCEALETCPVREWEGRYNTFDRIHGTADPLWYGADILEKVRAGKVPHEIACHGYTHRTFDRLDSTGARTEIEEWLRVAGARNIEPKTIVFPRNEVGHLELFREYGFICYRGSEVLPPLSRWPIAGPVFRKLYETIAAFLPPVVYEPRVGGPQMVNLPSSKALFGLNRRMETVADFFHLPRPRIGRITKGIARAAAEKKVLHIYAHPYEFRSGKDVDMLRRVLEKAAGEIAKGTLLSVGMGELARKVLGEERQRP
jgi:peptidoglycan/xylan/chitin deacetylase (PgdA/CDA1 family)